MKDGVYLISDIKGKISHTGSNLTSRLEDKLTGDFFGAIRYLPIEEGLSVILSQVKFKNTKDNEEWHAMLSSQVGYVAKYSFWPKHTKGEIDLLIEFENVLIGIEVKYMSGISSEDKLTEDEPMNYKESAHQLSRYSQMLEEIADNRKAYLVFLAPYEIQRHVQRELGVKYDISPFVKKGYVTWEDLHTALASMNPKAKSDAQKLILSDTEQLLRVKRLVRFSGFTRTNSLLNIPHFPYVYKKEIPSSTWTWSENHLVEEQPYVYNTK